MTALHQVPPDIAANVRRRWPDRGTAWTRQVLAELHTLTERHNAEVEKVFPARYGLVVAVSTPSGPLVLRSTADPAGPDQAQFAQAFAARGIGPAVYEVISTETSTWTVTERITPGHSIAETENPAEIAPQIATLFSAMIGQPTPAPNAPRLTDWLETRLTDQPPDDLPLTEYNVTEHDRQHAREVLAELRRTEVNELCHGDAHPDNILVGRRDELRWIDPRGMNGELAYDAAVLTLKAAPTLRAGPEQLGAAFAEHLGIDSDRTRAWLTVARAARV